MDIMRAHLQSASLQIAAAAVLWNMALDCKWIAGVLQPLGSLKHIVPLCHIQMQVGYSLAEMEELSAC